MIRVNLAARPFYNERLVSFLLGVTGVIALAVALFAVQQVVALSARRTELRSGIGADDAAAATADREAIALQHAIDAKALKGLAFSTQQANALIDERTFSWTTFFGLIEQTLPDDVRVTSVAPSFDKSGVVVVMTVVSRRPEDLAIFIEHLHSTGAFYDVLPRQEDPEDDGTRKTILEARYLPPKTAAPEGKTDGKSAVTPPPAANAKPAGGVK
mgnify:CR=1 FL=1